MKRQLLNTYDHLAVLSIFSTTFRLVMMTALFTACSDDDDKPKTIPEVTTAALANITTTTATGGGEIVSNGNATITASGLVYSNTNTAPTTADDKTIETATAGTFTSELEGLTSGTIYHVRAYATNSVGTGYGEVLEFITGNAAPTAANVSITGTVQVPEKLTATYIYGDSENDPEGASTFQWYIANDGSGAGETAIAGATELTYAIQPANEFKYIRFGVTPLATSGTSPGAEVKSPFVGPVAEEPTTVTFTYNGASVTYGIITSPVTGRRWLDRNLGAPNKPTAYDDWQNYGDLFQWGRGTDGHQLINRGSSNAATTALYGTTPTQSDSDNPGHNLFIWLSGSRDWRNPSNNNLWQGSSGINNPCPAGWHIPDSTEWRNENITLIAEAFNQLNLTYGGLRQAAAGSIASTTSQGTYWSSSKYSPSETSIVAFVFRQGLVTGAPVSTYARHYGLSCRCIKD